MKVRVFATSEEAARAAAAAVATAVAGNPLSVLGLPTGRTSLAVYDELVRLHDAGAVNFSHAHIFNIDEFAGIAPNDGRSYHAFMQKHLFGRINLPGPHIHFLDGAATDDAEECARFERELVSHGGMDFLLIGLGTNAHIGFNEPGRSLRARTHRVRLSVDTRRANALLFGGRLDDVPLDALTMGIATMLRARRVVLIATGRSKSKAVKSMLTGEISTDVPASMLQLHSDVDVILDLAAAEELPQAGFDPKP